MAKLILTSATHEELTEQFPHTSRPYAVWYNTGKCYADPDADNRRWVVNGDDGLPHGEFEDMSTALEIAADIGSVWEKEARKQAQALASLTDTNYEKVYSALPLDERMAYASEIADELLEESARQAALICALVDACKKGRDANPDAYHLAELLEERIINKAQIERLQSCFPE